MKGSGKQASFPKSGETAVSSRTSSTDKASDSASEIAFRNIIRLSVAGMLQTDPRGRFTFVNPCWCEMLGYSETELLQRTLMDVTHPESIAETREKVSQLLAGGPDFTLEKRYLRKDGSELWAMSNVSAVRDADGVVQQILAVVSDITEHKNPGLRSIFLADLSQRLGSLQSPSKIISLATEATGRYLKAHRCFFACIRDQEKRITVGQNWISDTAASLEGDYLLPDFFSPEWWELSAGGRLAVADTARDSLTRAQARRYCTTGVLAYAAESFRRSERNASVLLVVTDRSPRIWRKPELELLQDVVARVWPLVERAEAMEAVARSEAEFRAIFELSGVGMVQVDPFTTRVLRVNKKLCATLQYPADKLVGRTVTELTHPDDREETRHVFRDLIEGRIAEFSLEKRLIASNGRIIWASVNVTLLRDLEGRPLRTTAVVRDITPRKTAEWALAAEFEDLQRVHDISNRLVSEGSGTKLLGELVRAAVAILHADRGTILCYNEHSGELEMLHTEGFSGQHPIAGRISPRSRCASATASKTRERVIISDYRQLSEASSSEEVQALYSSGVMASQATPLIARSGKLVGVLATYWHDPHESEPRELRLLDMLSRQAADLVDQMRSEQALRQSEERFRVLVETAAQVVWEADPDGRMIGEPLDGLPSGGWPSAVHPEERAAAARKWRTALNSGRPLDLECRFRKVSGGWIWTNVRAAPLCDRDGSIRKWVGMNIDITAHKRAEAELRAARDELEERVAERTAELQVRANQLATLTTQLTRVEQDERRRLAGILHDHLQQLLVAAKMSVEMCGNGGSKTCESSLKRASALLTESLDASRSLMVELSPPVLSESLSAALEWLCFTWMREKHALEVSLFTDPQADSPREDIRTTIFLAVRELLFNVVKHAKTQQAWVTLTIDDDDFLRATVEDHGIGFEPDESLGTAAGTLSGLGLFSLNERLSMIGGHLEIYGKKGEGTCITVVVPRVIHS